MKELLENLTELQEELKVPKSQFNSFGKYAYRNQDDILEGVKPLLVKYGLTLTIQDYMENIGGFNYVVAVAELRQGEERISTKAYAKEPLEQKGMSASQITGASSSYARKYALNGLFLIDDTKDADNYAPGCSQSSTEGVDEPFHDTLPVVERR